MVGYVTTFLTAPHRELGRAGAVCPFAAQATRDDLIRLTACSAEDEPTIIEGMARLRSELAPQDEGAAPINQALIAVFPTLREPDGARLIETVQKTLKRSFVERKLMIGQFFPSCSEPGLWNQDFRPLQSPVISLAIRNMTIFDGPFMLERPEYASAFVRAYGSDGRARMAKAARDRGLIESGGWLEKMLLQSEDEAL